MSQCIRWFRGTDANRGLICKATILALGILLVTILLIVVMPLGLWIFSEIKDQLAEEQQKVERKALSSFCEDFYNFNVTKALRTGKELSFVDRVRLNRLEQENKDLKRAQDDEKKTTTPPDSRRSSIQS